MFRNFVLMIFFILYGGITAQNDYDLEKNNKLNIFIDCNRCDNDYVKEQITFVNYVRDRNNSDVHILINSIRTGGGGREYTLTFIGQNKFNSINDTLTYSLSESVSENKNRTQLVHYIKLGLVKYVSKTSLAESIDINYFGSDLSQNQNSYDDWNYWVFRTRLRGWLNGEKSTNSLNLWGSFSVDRVTEDLKIRFSLNGDYNEDNYEYEGETYTSISRQQRFHTSVILSHSPNWSYGFFGSVYSSIYDNMRLGASFRPGIEYNFFPYNESTRRQLRINYQITLGYNNYDEETVYFKTEETYVKERISIALDLIQPWGNIETEFFASHYMHDLNLHFLEFRTEFRINIITGLTLDLFGRLAYIHDQISLPRSGVNLEEVLLRQKQLETNYEYWARFGFTYSFGSIYNNIVNTRFGN